MQWFSKATLQKLLENELPRFYAQTRTCLEGHSEKGSTFDLQEVFLDLTTRIMGQLAYNVSLFRQACVGEMLITPRLTLMHPLHSPMHSRWPLVLPESASKIPSGG